MSSELDGKCLMELTGTHSFLPVHACVQVPLAPHPTPHPHHTHTPFLLWAEIPRYKGTLSQKTQHKTKSGGECSWILEGQITPTMAHRELPPAGWYGHTHCVMITVNGIKPGVRAWITPGMESSTGTLWQQLTSIQQIGLDIWEPVRDKYPFPARKKYVRPAYPELRPWEEGR